MANLGTATVYGDLLVKNQTRSKWYKLDQLHIKYSDFSDIWNPTSDLSYETRECIKLRDNFHSFVTVDIANIDRHFFIVLPSAKTLAFGTILTILNLTPNNENLYIMGYTTDGEQTTAEQIQIANSTETDSVIIKIPQYYGVMELIVSCFNGNKKWHCYKGGLDAWSSDDTPKLL